MYLKFYLYLDFDIDERYYSNIVEDVVLVSLQIHYYWRLRLSFLYLGVGKSCLLLQYTDKRYRDKH